MFEGEKFIDVVTGTTNPGTPVLQGGFLKYNKVGAAVVKSDTWYYDVWAYGLHMGKMPALRQVGKITVFRDGDKDSKSEEIGAPITGFAIASDNHFIAYTALICGVLGKLITNLFTEETQTEETKAKMSTAQKGRILSEETKAKLSASSKGKLS